MSGASMSDRPDEKPAQQPGAGSTGRAVARAAGRAATGAARGTRRAIRRDPRLDRAYRTGVGVVGGTTVALGVVLIPLPGPGSLVALGGLGILATEFEGAKKVSRRANAAAARAVDVAREARRRRRDPDPAA
jgi:uncharacterized protein (TIGR02611 family)